MKLSTITKLNRLNKTAKLILVIILLCVFCVLIRNEVAHSSELNPVDLSELTVEIATDGMKCISDKYGEADILNVQGLVMYREFDYSSTEPRLLYFVVSNLRKYTESLIIVAESERGSCKFGILCEVDITKGMIPRLLTSPRLLK